MLKIYGHAASINVRKVLWTCEELGLPFEREDRDTRALNPVRMVPVIDDGGVIVWESNVIVRYLATSRGRSIPMPRPHYPNVERYYEQLLQRGGLQRYGRDGGP